MCIKVKATLLNKHLGGVAAKGQTLKLSEVHYILYNFC